MTVTVPYSGVGNRLGLEEIESIMEVLHQDTLAYGPMGDQLEAAFASRVSVRHATATNSCTTALYLTVQVLGLKEGDEVITTTQTFWGAVFPFLARRCVVRFADVDPNSLNMDPTTIEPLITERTKAIYVLHHGGQAADMDPIMAIARAHGLRVVEDCVDVPGTTYKGKPLGTIGDLGCFSFQSLKNMTTGEGGMVVTNDDELYARARALSRIGTVGEIVDRSEAQLGPYHEPGYLQTMFPRSAFRQEFANDSFEVGNNYRLSELQAAVGIVQLRKLDRLNARRRLIASQLDAGLSEVDGISLQEEQPYAHHIYHLYTCFFEPDQVGAGKEEFVRRLVEDEGIQIVLRYFPVHLLPELRAFGHKVGECPIAERVYFERQIQLPIYDHLTGEQITHMIEAIGRTIERMRASSSSAA